MVPKLFPVAKQKQVENTHHPILLVAFFGLAMFLSIDMCKYQYHMVNKHLIQKKVGQTTSNMSKHLMFTLASTRPRDQQNMLE